MNIKRNNSINNYASKDGAFLKKDNISNTPQSKDKEPSIAQIKRIKVFKHIEVHQPISIYKVHKDLKMAYTTASYIIRDLIFAGVVSERVEINENNTAVKILTVPKLPASQSKKDEVENDTNF